MARKRGCLGVVHVSTSATTGFTALGELTDWSFEEVAERIDASTMGTCTKQYEAGAVESSLEFTTWWDGDDAPQALLTPAATIHVRLYPEGTGSGKNWYKTPTAGSTVLSVRRQGGGTNGLVGATFSLSVNGAMTATATP